MTNLAYLGREFLPDGALLVSEWPGQLHTVRDGVVSAPLAGAPQVVVDGEATHGMLDVVAHPDFADNRTIYMCHLHGSMQANASHITRARLGEDGLEDLRTLSLPAPMPRTGRCIRAAACCGPMTVARGSSRCYPAASRDPRYRRVFPLDLL